MKKIPSLFKRDYEDSYLVYDEVVPGCEWVLEGEGVATIKFDGSACLVRDRQLYKRYDRKLTRAEKRRQARGDPLDISRDFKPSPNGWEPCEPEPNKHTGHWPGWAPVGDGPEDRWYREAWDRFCLEHDVDLINGCTFELVGPKVQGNPYDLKEHQLWIHGLDVREEGLAIPPRNFEGLKRWFEENEVEGIVWHHPDGRMCKIKRQDFGLEWPAKGRLPL